jgi:hypothetical protein
LISLKTLLSKLLEDTLDLFFPQIRYLNLFRLEALPDRSAPLMELGNSLVDFPLGGA